MRIAKRIVLLMLVLTIIVGGCGCRLRTNRNNRKENTQGKIIASMRKHLDDKYGYIDYDVIAFRGAGWDHSYDVLHLSTEIDGEEKEFDVKRYKTDDGYEYQDDYFPLLIIDDFEEKVFEGAKKYFTECKVFCGIWGFPYPNSLTIDSDIDDFFAAKDELGYVSIDIVVNEIFSSDEIFMDTAHKYADSWRKEGLKTILTIYYLKNEGYEVSEEGDFSEILKNYCIAEYEEDIE